MIAVPILIFLAMIIAKAQKGVFASFLVLVATKSVVDAFWDYKFGPLSMLAIQGVLIPVLYYKVILERKKIPKDWLRTANIYFVALSFGIIWAILIKPINFVDFLILNINIYIGFILIPLLVYDRTRLKQLLLAIMICGIFPIAVSVFQLKTGIIFRERETVGLTRYVGFYHDAFPVRFFGLMTIFSILLYQTIFKRINLFLNVFMLIMAIGAFVSIYAIYSKAAVGIFTIWILIMIVFSKSRIKQLFLIFIGLFGVSIVFGDAVTQNIEQLFSKEVGYQTGEVEDAKFTLAGRGYIWKKYWDYWTTDLNFFFQWVGDGVDRPAHNEFLRILMLNGIIGFMFFIMFLFKSIINVFRIYKGIRTFAFMLMGMYFVDCLGLAPGAYYYYNILVWGIFGTLLLRPHIFLKEQ